MSKYRIYGIVHGSKLIGEFEAESEEAAKDMAAKSVNCCVNLCHHCAREVEDAEVGDFQAEKVEE